MALIACRACGKSVADEAKTCPHCGINAPSQEIFELLEAAAGFGVEASSFDRYDAETIRRKARDALEQMGMNAALEEAKEQKHRLEIRRGLIVWAIIILLGIALFTGLLDPLLRHIMT